MPNRLSEETSPYLLQHAENPVDWQPWDERALAEAVERDVPLLVSIGYAACHWCHVMEHESFADPAIAELMNSNFVCIKVDREERPDVDALFMEACQMLNGHGGWPLNAFATPDGKPFWVGTYFPPADTVRNASWRTVLTRIAEAWREDRDGAVEAGERIAPVLVGAARLAPAEGDLPDDILETAIESLRGSFDPANGGFGGAPKFPSHEVTSFLLASGELEMSIQTLEAIAAGGIHDQIGGGFCRYAVDATWTIPHFEKMLYDNALLANQYLDAWQWTGDDRMLATCRSTLSWMERDLLGPDGGFHASLDADDPLGEGRFYSWTPEQVRQVFASTADADLACSLFGITGDGNFEDGLTVPTLSDPQAVDAGTLARLRAAMLEVRSGRPAPAVDTKVITAWNSLAITAFARAGALLDDSHLIAVAERCAEHLLSDLRGEDGRLMRCRTAGRAVIPAVLEDHAMLLAALLDLYEATFEQRWFESALELEETTWERFGDHDSGGYFTTASDAAPLAARRKDLEDQPIPSGQSTMALALTRLHGLTGDSKHLERADGVLRLLGPVAGRAPLAVGRILRTLLITFNGLDEVAIVGPGADGLIQTFRSKPRPTAVIAASHEIQPDGVPLLRDRTPVGGKATAWVCRDFACRAPVTEQVELAAALDDS